MTNTDRKSIKNIVGNLPITKCILNSEVLDCIKRWERICKPNYRNGYLSVKAQLTTCSLDCSDKSCEYLHSQDPSDYRKHWDSKMKIEISKVVKPKLDELLRMKSDIERYEQLRIEGLRLEEEAREVYMDELENMNNKRKLLKRLQYILIQVEHAELTLTEFVKEFENRPFKQWFTSYFYKSEEETEALETITKQKEFLLNLLNRCFEEEKEISQCFGLTTPMLVKLDELPDERYRTKKTKDLQKLLQKCMSLARDPILKLVPSNSINLKKILFAAIGHKKEIDHLEKQISDNLEDLKPSKTWRTRSSRAKH